MEPIDITEDDGRPDEPAGGIRYREMVGGEAIVESARDSLRDAVQEELEGRGIDASSSKQEAREIVDRVSDSELEDFYRDAASKIDPGQVTSLDFVDEIDAYAADAVVDAYLED